MIVQEMSDALKVNFSLNTVWVTKVLEGINYLVHLSKTSPAKNVSLSIRQWLCIAQGKFLAKYRLSHKSFWMEVMNPNIF